jgi:hypothetical protein
LYNLQVVMNKLRFHKLQTYFFSIREYFDSFELSSKQTTWMKRSLFRSFYLKSKWSKLVRTHQRKLINIHSSLNDLWLFCRSLCCPFSCLIQCLFSLVASDFFKCRQKNWMNLLLLIPRGKKNTTYLMLCLSNFI